MFVFLLSSTFVLALCAAMETTASLLSVTDTLSHDRSAGFHKSSTSPGIITTVAGDPFGSVTDGVAATSKRIKSAEGLAFDKEGNFYIAAPYDNRIYKVTASSGIITTVAGTGDGSVGSYGGDGGKATSAMLNGPKGLSLDTAGDIYIADTRNNRIRRVTMSTGLITTVAGDGGNEYYAEDNIAATSTSLKSPSDVAVDPSGNMFIADTGNARIRKVTASTGIMTIIAGTGEIPDFYSGKRNSAIATRYYIFQPAGVTLDTAGNVYIAGGDMDPSIFKITVSTGNISIVAGTGPYLIGTAGYNGDDILATAADLKNPRKVAFDASGNMYISDTSNRRIRKVTASTGMITTVVGTGRKPQGVQPKNGEGGLATAALIDTPSGIAVDTAGSLYFADEFGAVVRKVAFNGATPSASVTSAPSVKGAPSSPPSAPVTSTPTASAPTPGASSSSPFPSSSSSSMSSSPSSSPAVSPSISISLAPATGASSSPSISSSSKAPVAPSSTATQSSSTIHFAQTLHLTIIFLSSLLILHLCRDA